MLDIVVVGGSVFGLAAATTLSATGHSVTILESNAELNVSGGSIVFLPCATRLLTSWGLEPILAPHTTFLRCFQSRDGYTGEILGHAPCNVGEAAMLAYGARWWCTTRKAFLQSLCSVAEQRGVNVVFNARLNSISEDGHGVHAHCENGQSFTADLVIGADGVDSTVRKQIPGIDIASPIDTDEQHFSCTVSSMAAACDEGGMNVMSLDNAVATSWMMAGKSMLTWPTLSPAPLELDVAVSGLSDLRVAPGDWNVRVSPSYVQTCFPETSSPVSKALSCVDSNVMAWSPADIFPLSTWSSPSSRIVLGGDAAHAMLPHSAGSATCAVEDAAVLAEALGSVDKDQASALAKGIRLYELSRMPRTSRLQELSRSQQGFLSLNNEAADRRNNFLRDLDAKMWAALKAPEDERRETFIKGFSPYFPSFWLYGFDALEEYKTFVAKLDLEVQNEA